MAADEDEGEPEEESPDDPPGVVTPVENVGGHTKMISNLVFGTAGRRLYTTGRPGEVAEWDARSGERMRVWRFPASAYRLAVSRDGQQLATVTHYSKAENKARNAVWLIDATSGKENSGKAQLGPIVSGQDCYALALTPDGKRLAASIDNHTEIHPLQAKAPPVVLEGTGKVRSLAFDKSGRWLLVAAKSQQKTGPGSVAAWDLSGKGKPRRVTFPGAVFENPRTAWSAGGKNVAAINGGKAPGLYVWSFDEPPRLIRKVDGARLLKAIGGEKGTDARAVGVAFVPGLAVVAAWNKGGRLRLVRIDVKKDLVERLPTDIRLQHEASGRMAVSGNGLWLAATSDPAFRVALYDLEKQKEVRRLGPKVRVPRMVAWSADSRGVAWGFTTRPGKDWQKALTSGLSLAKLEHLSKEDLAGARVEAFPTGWALTGADSKKVFLVQGKKKTLIDVKGGGVQLRPSQAFKDEAGKVRLIVAHDNGRKISIIDPATGKAIARVGPKMVFSPVYDLAVSPDRKYLLVAGGDQALAVYALAQPAKPLLEVLAAEGGDWVVWTPKGYYAGSPGGEKLIGWKVATAPDRLATFYPAETFRKKLYRPEVIQKVLDAGSVEGPCRSRAAAVRSVSVEDVLPPRVNLVQVEQGPKDKGTVSIHVTAESPSADQPVQMLRLLVDGRPLPNGEGVKEIKEGQKAEAKWTIPNMPGGRLELKVLARCKDVTGVSAVRIVEVPVAVKDRPVLHILAVGINYKGKPGLALDCAQNDATAVVQAFNTACTGKDNLFRQEKPPQKPPQLLLEEAATTKAMLAALKEIRRKVKPQDLVVFFYAGHGVRDGKQFYLLSHDADLKDLKETALSGDKLRETFKDFPCQVLLLLDACHAGAAARGLVGFKAATDEASRQLADEECGTTLLAAAMGYEKALEVRREKNGLFTQGLIKALGETKNLPHNHWDGRQYVHHLFSFVFDAVKHLSEDRQHPFLSLPWTSESFALRQVAKAEVAAAP